MSPLPESKVIGVSIVPHTVAPEMRYTQQRGPGPAALVRLFIKGGGIPETFNGKTPDDLVKTGNWAWHDAALAVPGSAETLTVLSFNGKSAAWGAGNAFTIDGRGTDTTTIKIEQPKAWVTAVTYRGPDGAVHPNRIVIHIRNNETTSAKVTGIRIWLPKPEEPWQLLHAGSWIPVNVAIPAADSGVVSSYIARLPLTYAAVEVRTSNGNLWAYSRIKAEHFAISGGWINNEGSDAHKDPAFLGLLKSLHIDTAHYQELSGYSDNPDLFNKFKLRRFNKLDPIDVYSKPEKLIDVHAVEFLGEPQYGGGKPVPPQTVHDRLVPYKGSPLPTSVTHSEERIWRWYAGVCDFPHYDAYRVTAPAADQWTKYDRWGGKKIRWGAPLETIGVMCRSLRALNQPLPCAYWSQGPHEGWDDPFDGRKRRSPTPAELRAQAIHALGARIVSLYWFNLSLNSLMMFPDTWDAMRRVGREIRMLEPILLDGDHTAFQKQGLPGAGPDWELSVVSAPDAAVCVAADVAYKIGDNGQEFVFGKPRPVRFAFPLPSRLRKPVDVFRVDADGVFDVKWQAKGGGIVIDDVRSEDAIYVVGLTKATRQGIVRRHSVALAHEEKFAVEKSELDALWKRDSEKRKKKR